MSPRVELHVIPESAGRRRRRLAEVILKTTGTISKPSRLLSDYVLWIRKVESPGLFIRQPHILFERAMQHLRV